MFYVDSSRRDCQKLQTAVQDERERAHLLERDRDTLAYNVKRMTSERDAVANERVGLEEKVLNLEVLMADLKDECNTLRVRYDECNIVRVRYDECNILRVRYDECNTVRVHNNAPMFFDKRFQYV